MDSYDAIAVEWITCISTATEELSNEERIKVYPNPAGDWVKISIPESTLSLQSEMKIFDVTGKLVKP